MCWSAFLWCKWALNRVWKPRPFVHTKWCLSLPELDIGSWCWVICTKKSTETALPFLEVSGSERFGFRLTVSKHQPSWSTFLMLFPGRQWHLCSFRIVFHIYAFSPGGSAGTLKKKIIYLQNPLEITYLLRGDWGLNKIGEILRSRYALIENIL